MRERIKRYVFLQHILEVYRSTEDDKPHDVPIWEAWLHKTAELPPDFDNFPTVACLPDILRFQDGTQVTTPELWKRRREEVLKIVAYYQLGNLPPPPAAIVGYETGWTEDEEMDCIRNRIALVFAPTKEAMEKTRYPTDPCYFRTAQLKVELSVPRGKGPFPAVIGIGHPEERVYNHAVKRGYLVCNFDDSDAFACKDVYTEYDCNQLVWWAWSASRCIDYLHGLDIADKTKIAVIGHSRGGKMALICAALDERVCAAIASHTGAGSGMSVPWRCMGEKYGSESLEVSTRLFPYWNHPRMRFFIGRENKLPFDSHFMIALVAPRSLLITEGDRDEVGEPWGAQQAYLATKEVYKLLGAEDRLDIAFSCGEHRLDDATLQMYIDWLDMQFGRKPRNFPEKLMYTYTFDKWKEVADEAIDLTAFPEKGLDDLLINASGDAITTSEEWEAKKKDIRKRILWVLGELPSYQKPSSVALTYAETGVNLRKAKLPIDEKLVCHLTYPPPKRERFPVAIYCHAYLDQRGFDWSRSYGWGASVGERLARKGFLAVEFDQFGYGTRNHDCGIEFYAEHPRQSAMGVMVQDVRRIIDAVSNVKMADQHRIVLVGYSLGGAVALHAAALDERVKAVASVCGFASMRMDIHGDATEALKRYSHLRPTLPRLGFFVGHEKRVPYDYHEILAMIAPRHVLIVAPSFDQDWFLEDVTKCYEEVSKVFQLFKAPSHIEFYAPNDFNRYPPKYQNMVNDWLWTVAGVLRNDRRKEVSA